MDFSQMHTQVGNFIQDDSTARETRIKDAINRRYDEIAAGTDWPELTRIFTTEVTVTAAEANVYLPYYIDIVKRVIQDSDGIILEQYDPATFFERNFGNLTRTGNGTEYTLNGTSAVKREVSSAETLDVVSSDSGDTSIDVEIWGLVGGDEVNETVVLTGTTPVATTNSFSRISRIGTAATTVNAQRSGVITVSGTTSTTEYATLPQHVSDSRYTVLRLQPVPTAGTTLSVVYKKRIVPLINDGDTLEIPVGPAIVELAIADINRQQHKWQAAQFHEGRGQRILIDYLSRLHMQAESNMQSRSFDNDPYGPGRVVVRGT